MFRVVPYRLPLHDDGKARPFHHGLFPRLRILQLEQYQRTPLHVPSDGGYSDLEGNTKPPSAPIILLERHTRSQSPRFYIL